MRSMRKLKRFWTVTVIEFRIWLAVGLLCLAVIGLAILLFSPYFDVREINIRRGDGRIDIEQAQQALKPLFHERLLFVSRAHVRNLLDPVYPDLDEVEIDKTYPSTLGVLIVLDDIFASVVIDRPGGSGATLAGSGVVAFHQYVTRNGYLVSSPTEVKGGPFQQITLTDWAVEPKNRTRVFRPDHLKTILLAADILRRDYGLSTIETKYFMRAQEFHISTDKTELWFDLASPLTEQLQRFRQFLAEASFDDAKQYIDLRIADTIVYK